MTYSWNIYYSFVLMRIYKRYWRQGFAKEAAIAVRNWVFRNTEYKTIYNLRANTRDFSHEIQPFLHIYFTNYYNIS